MSTLNLLRCAPHALKKQPVWVAPSRNIALSSFLRDAPAATASTKVLPGHEYYPGKEEYGTVIGKKTCSLKSIYSISETNQMQPVPNQGAFTKSFN